MKALLIGATGATGSDLLQELLVDKDFTCVEIFVRKVPEINHPKLVVNVVNFERPEEWKEKIKGDVAFSALGTTLKDAQSKEAQYRVDYTYQFRFAQAAKENSVTKFVLVSSYGANSKSKLFYSRMKGELEEAVRALHFETTIVFQPGMLERKNSTRTGEVLGARVIRFANSLGILHSQRPLPTKVLAKAMSNASKIKSSGYSTIPLTSIWSFASKKTES